MSYKNTEVKQKPKGILSLPLKDKTILWLPDINKYILVISPIDEIIEKILNGENEDKILEYSLGELELSQTEANQIITSIKKKLEENREDASSKSSLKDIQPPAIQTNFSCKRYYQINNIVFFAEYETPGIEFLIHPKFAHLETIPVTSFDVRFQLYKSGSEIALRVNETLIGSWPKEEEHFMTGKVSMEILQKIHNNNENDWMAVFHAAGVSNGKESIMFFGDSGNGKSTLSAILLANGFDVLADDFLPVESKMSFVSSFPAAISVKKQAIDFLAEKFPELKNATEYKYPLFNKTVRYLSNPKTTDGKPNKVPCKALVFVKFDDKTDLQFEELPKDIAFQKLVPDSWISPLATNAKQFLNWFSRLPCYQLTYSNNEAMVRTIKDIFNNEI